MPKISILHPSYKRPQLGVDTIQNWLNKATEPKEIEYILCLSNKDTTISEYLKNIEQKELTSKVKIFYCDDANMVKQVNLAASQSTGNLLVNVSDDFDCLNGWDLLLLSELEGKEDYIVKTQDGIQPEIITLPIMDRKYYDRFGYIYHPDYLHFYGDEELRVVGDKLGKTIVSNILFEHLHYIANKSKMDETNEKNNAHFNADKLTFARRKKQNFPI